MRRVLLGLGALAACGDWATGPGSPPDEFRFTATARTAPPAVPVLTVSPGALAVDAVVLTPLPCYEAAARVQRAQPTLIITITVQRAGENACITIQGALAYHLRITQLTPGAHDVILRHTVAGAAEVDTVLRATVVIP
jgi:hypothetical protein